MFLIDLKSRTPIYAQVVDNFKRLIVSGALPPDEKAPSVRELARMLTVNPNTVQKAYRELEARGYFYTVLGQGNFIAKPDTTRETEALFKRLGETVAELAYRGASKEEIRAAAENAFPQHPHNRAVENAFPQHPDNRVAKNAFPQHPDNRATENEFPQHPHTYGGECID